MRETRTYTITTGPVVTTATVTTETTKGLTEAAHVKVLQKREALRNVQRANLLETSKAGLRDSARRKGIDPTKCKTHYELVEAIVYEMYPDLNSNPND